MTLDQLPRGATAKILTIRLGGPSRQRLQDLGFLPGVRVQASLENPLGDPRAFSVLGGLVALRDEQARLIVIEPEEDPNG